MLYFSILLHCPTHITKKTRGITTRERELHYREQQSPEIQQIVHLKMAI
jgi:hypothetical protein